ncbi:MAG: putative DNA binding domain-containing protein [Gammaproteobacteria bacterium]|nr:putative DNA binding domain-containing protein [Gammaproteobacteria bacterium]
MKREELIERLKGYEWNDVEFKEAQRGVPKNAYETVSAFANTGGGWLVFGVRDAAAGFEIVGVLEVDKVQNDFLSALRTGDKLNRIIESKEDLIEEEGKALLVFHIPEARRQDKPVYLKRDIWRSFIRRGAGDERCTPAEIERMLRDAADERYDGETLLLEPDSCFDDGSLRWYRKLFDDRNPGYNEELSHLEFLRDWGLIVEADGRLSPTRAAILLFGSARAFRQVLPRPVVDWRWSRGDWAEELTDERWADRLVIENNLVSTWRALVARYFQRAEKPFSLDPETLQREDHPPDYTAFREAAINLLIHQDYADQMRSPVIHFFEDRTTLWNPGDAYASADELLEPGEREVRNPRIVGAFRRIGLSEQAGTGMRAIFGNWRQLGRVPPIVDNDRAEGVSGDPPQGRALVRRATPLPSEPGGSSERSRSQRLRPRLPPRESPTARRTHGRRSLQCRSSGGSRAVGGPASRFAPGQRRRADLRPRGTSPRTAGLTQSG